MGELKPGWKRWRFEQIATSVTNRVDDPREAGVDYYVGLEHLDSDTLKIRRWGSPDDVAATKLLFEPGDIIFGRRRAYQRKLGVAEFRGIASAHSLVLRAKPDVVLPEFLPFFMQSDIFMDRAQQISVGSLSPTINWKTLAKQEFALPPLEEQHRIARMLRIASGTANNLHSAIATARSTYSALGNSFFVRPGRVAGRGDPVPRTWAPTDWPIRNLGQLNDPAAPICYGIVKLGESLPDGIPVLRTENLNGDYDDVRRVHPDVDHAYRRSRVKPGDILLAIQGVSTGKIGRVPPGFAGNVNRHLARLRCSSELSPTFFHHLWNTMSFSRYVAAVATGTTKPELPIGVLRRLEIPLPPRDVQDEVSTHLGDLERTIAALQARYMSACDIQRRLRDRVIGRLL